MRTHIVQQTKHERRHDINEKYFLNCKKMDETSQR